MRNDYQTSNVRAAADYERAYSEEYADTPDAADTYQDPTAFVPARLGGQLSGAEWDQWFANEWARVSAEADAKAAAWTPDLKH